MTISLEEIISQDTKDTGVDTYIVGSIQQSILSLVQFQDEMENTNWVLMDGSDITGSALATLTGNNLLPDATGRFLRTAGGAAAAVGVGQAEGTAVNGLSTSTSTVTGSTDVDHDHGALSTDNPDTNHSHTATHDHPNTNTGNVSADHGHIENSLSSGSGSSFVVERVTGSGQAATVNSTNGISTNHYHGLNLANFGVTTGTVSAWHQHPFTIPNYNTANRALSSGVAAAQALSGDAETRPINVTVNTFIKIN